MGLYGPWISFWIAQLEVELLTRVNGVPGKNPGLATYFTVYML